MHVAVAHELTLKSKFARSAIAFANLPSLQSCHAVTSLPEISRAPTSIVCGRAKKRSPLSRAERLLDGLFSKLTGLALSIFIDTYRDNVRSRAHMFGA
jgi:hypothetical protein